jgi:hypothetical protein
MKNFLFSMTCFVFLSNNLLLAQTTISEVRMKKADADKVAGSKLIVMLIEPNKKYTDMLEKKKESKELDRSIKIIQYFNDTIQQFVSKYFPFVKEVEYKTLSEINEMTTESRKFCSFLAYNIGNSVKVNLLGPGVEADVPTYEFYEKKVQSPLEKRSFDFEKSDASYGKMELYIYNKKEKGYVVFYKTLPHIAPSPGDIAYWLMRANYIFEDVVTNGDKPAKTKETTDNAHYLKEKTMLICKDNLDKSATEAAIKKVYPYSFKIVSQEGLDSAIIAKENDKCVLVVLQMDAPLPIYSQEIMDLSTSEIVAFGMPKAMVAGIGGTEYKHVKPDHLKKYAADAK